VAFAPCLLSRQAGRRRSGRWSWKNRGVRWLSPWLRLSLVAPWFDPGRGVRARGDLAGVRRVIQPLQKLNVEVKPWVEVTFRR